jgi:hypothetical protein
VNNHGSKLLEDVLEAAYRDHVRLVIGKVFEQYLVPGPNETVESILRRMREGLQRLHEAHVLLSKEVKNNT